MRVLVTGASGFIGRHTVELLKEQEDLELVYLGRAPSKLSVFRGIQYIGISDSDWTSKVRACAPDAIVNLAVDYGRDGEFLRMLKCNLTLPVELLKIAIDLRCRCFINADSFYSKSKRVPAQMMDYLLMKKAMGSWLESAAEKMVGVAMLFEHVYGPFDRQEKFVPSILAELRSNGTNLAPIHLTPGEQVRDFVFVTDVSKAILTVVRWAAKSAPQFLTCEVGTGTGVTLRTFVEELKRQACANRQLIWGAKSYDPDEIMNSKANIAFLRGLGWQPEVPYKKGIELLLASQDGRTF